MKELEVAVGIEPTNKSFADSRLNHLATPPNWSGRRDLNSRPPPWQGGALPLSYSRVSFMNGVKEYGRTS